MRQPDARLRALNSEPTTPGPREEVYCTKVGTTRPDEMYIVGAHMDGHGWGEAANDDGSGTALVMELARIFSMPDVQTERTIRFALWNNEETGLERRPRLRRAAQGRCRARRSPPGSGRYPEPKWLGMIQHDMMMFDHGMPRADGTVSPSSGPRPTSTSSSSRTRRWPPSRRSWRGSSTRPTQTYATDYPAQVGPHMTNTDSTPFMDDRRRDQPARERARRADRQRLGSALAPAHRPVRHLLATRTSGSASTPRRRRSAAVAQLTGAKLKK